MAKKGKQKEPPRGKMHDELHATQPTQTSPAHKQAPMPMGGTSRPTASPVPSTKNGKQPFESQSQTADLWQDNDGGTDDWKHEDAGEEGGWGEDGEEEEDEDGQTADEGWREGPANDGQTPGTGAASPSSSKWGNSEQGTGGWGGGLASAITNAFGFVSHSQDQTEPQSATAAPEVTRKSTLKKKSAIIHEPQTAAIPPASKHVAFSTYSSSLARSSSPPLLGSSNPASLPNLQTPNLMHTRSQSQGAFSSGWGAPEKMLRGASNVQPFPATPGGSAGPWTQWRDEAVANEEARKHGVTRFATSIKANVPMSQSASATIPVIQPTRVMTTAPFSGGPAMPNVTNLQSQLHAILGASHALPPQQHSSNMRHRQSSLPANVGQPWQTWSQQTNTAQRPQQMQPSNSWGSTDWSGANPSARENLPDSGDGWGATAEASDWDGKQGGWGAEENAGWDQDVGYDQWDSRHETRKDGNTGKRGRNKGHAGGSDTGGWGTGGGTGWEHNNDKEWSAPRGRKASTPHGQGTWGNEWEVIPEEDEEDNEEEDYDNLDDMYTDPDDHEDRSKRKTTHSGISYQYQSPPGQSAAAWGGGASLPVPAQFLQHPDGRTTTHNTPPLPNPDSSQTMNFAAGRMTTVFELAPPRQGMGENTFIWSNGAGLQYAQRALYSRQRPAKERIYWAFNPQNDPRVASLMRWIEAMTNGLATIGLQKFVETGQRGALITNADYRSNASSGTLTQPAFDWITLPHLRLTCDRIFQESVVTYKPDMQVIVFVFLLSKSGNSMAVWRRKVLIPASVRSANKDVLAQIIEALPQDKVVYVDEMSNLSAAQPSKKKKRGFWKRLFGMK